MAFVIMGSKRDKTEPDFTNFLAVSVLLSWIALCIKVVACKPLPPSLLSGEPGYDSRI